eukprot:403352790
MFSQGTLPNLQPQATGMVQLPPMRTHISAPLTNYLNASQSSTVPASAFTSNSNGIQGSSFNLQTASSMSQNNGQGFATLSLNNTINGRGLNLKKNTIDNVSNLNLDITGNDKEQQLELNDSSSDSDSDDGINNRISTRSKVNFSKLSTEEKIKRLSNMASKIRKLKNQVRLMKMTKTKAISKTYAQTSEHIVQQRYQQASQLDIDKINENVKDISPLLNMGPSYQNKLQDQIIIQETKVNDSTNINHKDSNQTFINQRENSTGLVASMVPQGNYNYANQTMSSSGQAQNASQQIEQSPLNQYNKNTQITQLSDDIYRSQLNSRAQSTQAQNLQQNQYQQLRSQFNPFAQPDNLNQSGGIQQYQHNQNQNNYQQFK